MAISFVNKGNFTASTGSITPELPSGLQAGDLCLLFVESANEAISISSQGSIAWTEIPLSPQFTGTAAAAGGVRLAVYYGWYISGSTAPTVADSGNHTIGIIMAFRGVDPNTPFDVTPVGLVDSVNTTAISTRAITTVTDNAMIVNGIGLDQDANTTSYTGGANANLTNFIVRHYECSSPGAGGGLAVFTGILPTAGNSGNSTATKTGTGASSRTAYLTMALRPYISQQDLEVEGLASGAAVGAPKLMINPLPTTGLLGHWKFNDGSGTTVTDHSGGTKHGTIQGTGATWVDKGLQLTTNGYIQIPHLDLYTGKQFTFIVACNFSLTNASPSIMGSEDTALIYVSRNYGRVEYLSDNFEGSLFTQNSFTANKLVTVAVTYDNANFKAYLDGVLNNTVANAGAIANGSGPFYFNDTSSSYRDNCKFYYALVYDRALTAQEVADAYDFIQAELSARESLKITPSGIAPTGAIGLLALLPGSTNLALSGIPLAAATGALSFAPGSVNLQMPGIAPGTAMGAPAITPGNVGLPLGGIAPTQLTGLPTLVPGGVILGLNSIPSSEQLGIPILDSGAAALRPSGIPSGIQVGMPNIITGVPATKYIFPVGLISIASIGSPTMIRTFKLVLSGIGNVSFFGVPTITHSSFQMIELLGVENITYLGQPRLGALLILDGVSSTLRIGSPIFIQVLCYVKVGGVWLLGEIRFKIDGGWQSGLNLLPKVEGNWKNKEVS